MPVTVVAYVTKWCPDCARSRRALQRFGVSFREIDIESTPGAEEAMRAANGGSGKVPTLLLESETGTKTLIEPSDYELTQALKMLDHTVSPRHGNTG